MSKILSPDTFDTKSHEVTSPLYEKVYIDLNNEIVQQPEKINKISKDTLETLTNYLETNKSDAFDMYINIYNTNNSDKKLGRRDKKSLEKIENIIKENYGIRRFRRGGLENVHLEMTLTAIGYNLLKFHNKRYRIIQ